MKIIRIDVLFITGCPGYASAKKYIEELVVEEAIDAEVNLILIKSDEDSRRLHFIGSPTVRVGGMDIESGFVASRDYGVKGRLYSIDGKPSDFPSKEMIRNAIRKEVLLKDKGY